MWSFNNIFNGVRVPQKQCQSPTRKFNAGILTVLYFYSTFQQFYGARWSFSNLIFQPFKNCAYKTLEEFMSCDLIQLDSKMWFQITCQKKLNFDSCFSLNFIYIKLEKINFYFNDYKKYKTFKKIYQIDQHKPIANKLMFVE